MNKTVVFDFDGVIHKYSKGWQDGSIYDGINDNIIDTINTLRIEGYKVVVVSTRCNTEEGIEAIKEYLNKNGVIVDDVCKEKPPAVVYVDDRAICYDPDSKNLATQIITFSTKRQQRERYEKLNELELYGLIKLKNEIFKKVNDEWTAKYGVDPIIQTKMMDEWIAAVTKYLE